MNYTQPNEQEHEDNPEEWLASALVFARTLGFLLKENEGIVIDLKGDMIDLFPADIKKIIVFSKDNQIKIDVCDEDLEEGQLIWITESEFPE